MKKTPLIILSSLAMLMPTVSAIAKTDKAPVIRSLSAGYHDTDIQDRAAGAQMTICSYYNDPGSFNEELNQYNVPKEDFVPVGLSVDLSWKSPVSYRSAITKAFSYSQTATIADTTFDARATLDMVNVEKEWNAILNRAANNDAASRAAFIDNAKLSGEFKITIEDTSSTANDIDNTKLKALDSAVLKWVDNAKGYNVTDFFEQKGNIVKDGNQYVITMALKDYANINKDLDEYFTALAANEAEKDDYAFVLEIEDSTVPAPTYTGTYMYQVTGTFGGFVDIKLNENIVSKVWFGNGNYEVDGDTKANVDAEDAANITVAKAGRPTGGGHIITSSTITRVGSNIVAAITADESITDKVLHIALYDSANVLLDYIAVPATISDRSAYIVFKDDPSAAYAKVFVWDSITDMIPEGAAETVEIN